MKLVTKYVNFLQKYKYAILIFWTIVLGFSIWLAPKFLGETSSDFNVPGETPASIANAVLDQEFPETANKTTFVLVIQSNEGNVLSDAIGNFCLQFREELISSDYNHLILGINGYYYLIETLESAAWGYVSDSMNATIIEIEVNYLSDDLITGLIDFIKTTVEELKPNDYVIALTGEEVLFLEMQESAERDILVMDAIVLPIALIVLALVLRSFRLMILPILSVGLSIAVSFFVMYPIAKLMPVFSFVPSVMMALVIAMSIDYSLFLLSRYGEEIKNGKTNKESIELMLEHAGHTISVSGLILSVTFMGLIFFPVGLLSSIGIGAAICILVTLVINLTLSPALLFTFGKFFSKISLKRKKQKEIPKDEKTRKEIALQNQLKSIWYKIGKKATKYSIPIIIIIFVLAIPMSIQLMNFDTTISNNHVLPRDGNSAEAYDIIKSEFKPGMVGPMYIIISTNETNGVLTQEIFTTSANLIQQIVNDTEITSNSFISISWASYGDSGFSIPFIQAITLLFDSSLDNDSNAQAYRMMFNRYTNEENSTLLIDVQPNFDPFSRYTEEWIKETREIIEEFQESSDYKFYLAGGSTSVVDTVDIVFDLFPLMIGVIVAIVYIMLALMFKSIFVPLRLIITVGLTISWIYGMAALIFHVGILDWLFPRVLGDISAVYWVTPVMSFSILLGLGLDYDIFLLSRISEYRNKGYTERASIIKGLYKTGGVISMAGIIMAIAFSGLMLSNVLVMTEFGFILTFAVLVDTFIIRTILVPAIMSIADKWNWWPGKKPEATKDEYHID